MILTLVGTQGFILGLDNWYRFDQVPIDKDVLLLPERLLDQLNEDGANSLKPMFDMIWNAAGWPRCMNYNEKGERVN
jgi:hypothetical protein